MTYLVSVVPLKTRPLDEGLTLRVEVAATSARQAERRVLRYVAAPAVVVDVRRKSPSP